MCFTAFTRAAVAFWIWCWILTSMVENSSPTVVSTFRQFCLIIINPAYSLSCGSDTKNAVGPFYLVSMQKISHGGKCVNCRGHHIVEKENSEITLSGVGHKMGCLEYISKISTLHRYTYDFSTRYICSKNICICYWFVTDGFGKMFKQLSRIYLIVSLIVCL